MVLYIPWKVRNDGEEMKKIVELNKEAFEQIKKVKDGVEYWSARELYRILDYATWQKFEVGAKVRETIAELGGTMPEDLPVVDSIKNIISPRIDKKE